MSDNAPDKPIQIALALSGGGSRAIAFHLGCLKSLHQAGILSSVKTISAVSGGSVIAALYCQHDGDFASFEAKVRNTLKEGFMWSAVRTVFTTLEGVYAATVSMLLLLYYGSRNLFRLWVRFSPGLNLDLLLKLSQPHVQRVASRTTIFRRTFSRVLFNGQTLSALRDDKPKLVIVACELRTRTAFYFSKSVSGSYRVGKTSGGEIPIAQAVTASAAYPGFLPALDEMMELETPSGRKFEHLILTDGGVYDNLGLAPLWPDRDPTISLHAEKYDVIIACRAGYANETAPPVTFWPSRMASVIECIHARTQNATMKRLFDLKKAGDLKGVAVPYLGQNDAALLYPPSDLVPLEAVRGYPTDFSAMSETWIEKLSLRGEQLTTAILQEHLSDIFPARID